MKPLSTSNLLAPCAVGVLAVCGCVLSDTLPDLETASRVDIEILRPADGDLLPYAEDAAVDIAVWEITKLPGLIEVYCNDELYLKYALTADRRRRLSLGIRPGNYAPPGSTLTIKAILTDVAGVTTGDSVRVRLEEYLSRAPRVLRPLDENTYILDPGDLIPLKAEYDGPEASPSLVYNIATDSMFTSPLPIASQGFEPPAPGYYFCRVKAVGSQGTESPWSRPVRFCALDRLLFSDEFAEFTSINNVVEGLRGTYLLGISDYHDAVMKCDRDLSRQWLLQLTEDYSWAPKDGTERADGSLCVAARNGSELYGVTSDGQIQWNLETNMLPAIQSIAWAADGALVCGLAGGGGNDPRIAKIDSTGNVAWARNLPGSAGCYGIYANSVADRFTFLVQGERTANVLGEIDLSGEVLWSTDINITSSSLRAERILCPLADDSILFGASSLPRAYLARIRPGGAYVWDRDLQVGEGRIWRLGAACECDDGSVVVVGPGAFVLRLDASGQPMWWRWISFSDRSIYATGVTAYDGAITTFGYVEYWGNGRDVVRPMAVRLDLDGNTLPQ